MTSRQRVLQFYPSAKLVRLQFHQYLIGTSHSGFIGEVCTTPYLTWKSADKDIDQIMLKKLEW